LKTTTVLERPFPVRLSQVNQAGNGKDSWSGSFTGQMPYAANSFRTVKLLTRNVFE